MVKFSIYLNRRVFVMTFYMQNDDDDAAHDDDDNDLVFYILSNIIQVILR